MAAFRLEFNTGGADHYRIVMTDFFPFVTGGRLRPVGVFAAVDDHVLRLDSTLHHALCDRMDHLLRAEK